MITDLGTPWQGTASVERSGWRQRTACLEADVAFAVDYLVCRHSGLGWVGQPYAETRFQRCGPVTARLAVLRTEYPCLE